MLSVIGSEGSCAGGGAADQRDHYLELEVATCVGGVTAAVLASLLRTAAQQGTDPVAVLAEIQRTGTIPAGLALAGAARSP